MTVKEIAKIAGVSPAAVSRYVNGGSLSEEKRKEIQKAIEETGFRPNSAGQTLRTGKTNLIGVIVPKINSESVSNVTAGIAKAVDDSDYLILLGNCNNNDQNQINYISAMQDNNVSGIILMGTCYTPALISAIEKCTVPIVVTGQNFKDVNCVYHDDYNAAKAITHLMAEKGHKKICYIGIDEHDPAVGKQRFLGVQDALKEIGITDFPFEIADFTVESGFDAMEKLLIEKDDIDGVVCTTDMIALGAMNAIKGHGLKIPKDIAIAGIGNCWASTIVEPQITTVRLHFHQCGFDAADMLLKMLKSKDINEPIRQTMLGYTIIERGSI